jgi:hypothetical protein
MVSLQRDTRTITIDNGYWQVVHDLQQGGAVTAVRFLKDDGANFLAQPLEVRNGAYSSLRLTDQQVNVRRTRDGYRLRISGRMTDASGKAGPSIDIQYRYTEACARVNIVLRGAEGEVDCWHASFTRACGWVERSQLMFDADVVEAGWSRVEQEGLLYEVDNAPYCWGGYTTYGAGAQFMMTEVPESWRGQSRFIAEVDANQVELSHLHTATPEMRWGFHFSPTSFGRGEALKQREIVICSQPFPSDEELAQFKAQGVNLVRIHEGANWVNTSDDFWMTGMVPPYPGKNLQEMQRVIATCHRLGLPIYFYNCLSEIHPLSDAFLKHAHEWGGKVAGHYLRWSGPLTDQLWGAIMCSNTGYAPWLVRYIERMIKDYDYDGIYLDGTGTGYGVHDHGKNGIIAHCTSDSHLTAIEAMRRKMPDKFIVIHQVCSITLSVAQLNIADHVVTFEEMGLGQVPTRADDLPITMRIPVGIASTAIVPSIYVPDGGVPLTRCLFGFSYEEGKYPVPSREKFRKATPAFLLNGNVPYTYIFNEHFLWDYQNFQDRDEDTVGIYALFHALQEVGDTSGRFLPWDRCPYQADAPSVGVACIEQPERTILIIANQEDTALETVTITGPGLEPMRVSLAGYGYQFLSVKPAAVAAMPVGV